MTLRAIAVLAALACALGRGTGIAGAGESPQATAFAFIAAIDRGDSAAAERICDDRATLIDDFPPFVWRGPRACADAMRDFAALAHALHLTGFHVARRGAAFDRTANASEAYLCIPVRERYKLAGAEMAETNVWAIALRRVNGIWRISGFTSVKVR